MKKIKTLKKIQTVVASLLVLFMAAGPAMAQNIKQAQTGNLWGEYGADPQNTGQSPFVGPQTPDTATKTPLTYGNDETFLSPVIDKAGNVYFLDANREQRVRYYDPTARRWYYKLDRPAGGELVKYTSDGRVLWAKELPDFYRCIDEYGSTSLALANLKNQIYVICSGRTQDYRDPMRYRATLYIIDTTTGATLQEKNMSQYSITTIGSLTVDKNDNLYFTGTTFSDGARYPDTHVAGSLDSTGNIRWSASLGQGRDYEYAGPILSNNEKNLIVYHNTRYTTYFTSISTADGKVLWRTPIAWGGTGWQQQTSLAVDGRGTIWALSYYKDTTTQCYGYSTGLFGISSTTGNIVQQFAIDADISCGTHISVGQSGTIYITYDDVRRKYDPATGRWTWGHVRSGGIAAYDPVKGEKWFFELPDSYEANASPAIDANENIYFSASYGNILYKLDKNGNVVWQYVVDPDADPNASRRYRKDPINYGAMPIIGLGGNIYLPTARNIHIIFANVGQETVQAAVNTLISSGAISATDAKALLANLDNAFAAKSAQAKSNMLDAMINKVEAMLNSGRIAAGDADNLINLIEQLK